MVLIYFWNTCNYKYNLLRIKTCGKLCRSASILTVNNQCMFYIVYICKYNEYTLFKPYSILSIFMAINCWSRRRRRLCCRGPSSISRNGIWEHGPFSPTKCWKEYVTCYIYIYILLYNTSIINLSRRRSNLHMHASQYFMTVITTNIHYFTFM